MTTSLTLLTGGATPLAERPDDALMLLLCQGERLAFRALVERHGARLKSYCIKFVCDVRLGEEQAQETWCQVWIGRERYRPIGQFAVFLFTIARNRCRNVVRNRQREHRWLQPVEVLPELPVDATADERLLRREERVRLYDAFADLSEPQREATVLRFEAGLDYDAIAAVLECIAATARSHVFRAVAKLRERMSQEVS